MFIASIPLYKCNSTNKLTNFNDQSNCKPYDIKLYKLFLYTDVLS